MKKIIPVLCLLAFLATLETESFVLPPTPPQLKSRSFSGDIEFKSIDTMPFELRADLDKIVNAMINSLQSQKPIEKVPLVTGKYFTKNLIWKKTTNQI